MNDEIDITGLDPVDVIVALHDGTRPRGLGLLREQTNGAAIVRDTVARQIAERTGDTARFDYVAGRPVKVWVHFHDDRVTLSGVRLYDRDAGEGMCAEVIERLRRRDR